MAKQKFGEWEFTDKEIEDQLDESARLGKSELEPEATAIRYINNAERISLEFSDGFSLAFPTSKIKELRNASPSEVRKGALTEDGDAIHWDNLDAHYTVTGLLFDRFGTSAWMRELGKLGGRQTSEAKVLTARLNGQKGGRPVRTDSTGHASAMKAKSLGNTVRKSASGRVATSKSSASSPTSKTKTTPSKSTAKTTGRKE